MDYIDIIVQYMSMQLLVTPNCYISICITYCLLFCLITNGEHTIYIPEIHISKIYWIRYHIVTIISIRSIKSQYHIVQK
jgi:hypothetical protein